MVAVPLSLKIHWVTYIPTRLAWDQAQHWGKIGGKKNTGERSEPRGSLGRGKGGDPFPLPRPPLGSFHSKMFFLLDPVFFCLSPLLWSLVPGYNKTFGHYLSSHQRPCLARGRNLWKKVLITSRPEMYWLERNKITLTSRELSWLIILNFFCLAMHGQCHCRLVIQAAREI